MRGVDCWLWRRKTIYVRIWHLTSTRWRQSMGIVLNVCRFMTFVYPQKFSVISQDSHWEWCSWLCYCILMNLLVLFNVTFLCVFWSGWTHTKSHCWFLSPFCFGFLCVPLSGKKTLRTGGWPRHLGALRCSGRWAAMCCMLMHMSAHVIKHLPFFIFFICLDTL